MRAPRKKSAANSVIAYTIGPKSVATMASLSVDLPAVTTLAAKYTGIETIIQIIIRPITKRMRPVTVKPPIKDTDKSSKLLQK
jgi:hypothetical protein